MVRGGGESVDVIDVYAEVVGGGGGISGGIECEL